MELLVHDSNEFRGCKEIFVQLDYPIDAHSSDYYQMFGFSPAAGAEVNASIDSENPAASASGGQDRLLKVESFGELERRYHAVQCLVGSGTITKGLFEATENIPISWATFVNYHKVLSMIEGANIDPHDSELQRVTGPKIAREFVELKALERETHGRRRATRARNEE